MVENSIKEIGRIMTNSYYEYQKIRMASMNRMRDVIRKKLGGIASQTKHEAHFLYAIAKIRMSPIKFRDNLGL